MKSTGIAAASTTGVRVVAASEANNQKTTSVSDLAISNNFTEEKEIRIYIQRITNSNKPGYRRKIRLKGYNSPENPDQRKVHFKGGIQLDSSRPERYRVEIGLANGKSSVEIISFTPGGFPQEEIISAYVTVSGRIKTHHLYA